MREAIRRPLRRYQLLLWLVPAFSSLITSAQTPPDIPNRLVEQRLCLADLRNEWYTVIFPQTENRTRYSGKSEYLYSVVSPSGRSLFAVRRQFDQPGRHQFDTLIRRELQKYGAGPEEIISIPFENVFQFAVSPNEKLMVIAGRLRDTSSPKENRDGIFFLNRNTGDLRQIAPYASLSEQIRSFNVGDQGLVVYEDNGTIMAFAGSKALAKLVEYRRGQLPALLPDGQSYVYTTGGLLMLDNGKSKLEVLSAPGVIGAIRVSPDGNFIAFGVGVERDGETQLRVCELRTKACVDGPRYSEWIAGRETFWIKR